jgi:N-acetylmuramoyl-L-alanine amidase
VVILDPGHGGPDIGAADPSQTLVEKILTLRVAKQARIDLRRMGYKVYLTRTRDQSVNTPARDLNHDGKIDRLDDFDARTLFANRHHADIFVSIHFDASPVPDTHGTHGYYCPARPFWKKSAHLADLLTGAVSSALTRSGYRSPDNGVETDVADKVPQEFPNYPWFFVLGPSWRHRITGTAMPGALIESLFLSSPRDDAALRRSATIRALARGYANGIRQYFGGKTTR